MIKNIKITETLRPSILGTKIYSLPSLKWYQVSQSCRHCDGHHHALEGDQFCYRKQRFFINPPVPALIEGIGFPTTMIVLNVKILLKFFVSQSMLKEVIETR